jgi:hypothetical protein
VQMVWLRDSRQGSKECATVVAILGLAKYCEVSPESQRVPSPTNHLDSVVPNSLSSQLCIHLELIRQTCLLVI